MLRIRLFRTGKKNQPFFKIVVTDRRNPPRGGRFLEVLGFYNPLTKEKGLKKERIEYWISKGAKPSDTVHNLLVQEKILKGDKISVHKKKKEKPAQGPEGIVAGPPQSEDLGGKPKEETPKEEAKEPEKEGA